MTRRAFLFPQLLPRARLLAEDVVRRQNELAEGYNTWVVRFGEQVRNQVIDRRVLQERRKLEGLWERFWKAVEAWGQGW